MSALDLQSQGLAFYVDRLRQGATDPYVAYRVFDRSWSLHRKDIDLLRLATRQLVMADPWFLATAIPHLRGLRAEDLELLTPFVGAGPARGAAPMLRARLWYFGGGALYRKDRAARAQLKRALALLQQVKRPQRGQEWHEMVVGCYRVLDYDRYIRAVAALLRATTPEWRADPLCRVLRVAASRKDWSTYDRYRRDWERLPPNHHGCECAINDVSTCDGLRAVAARQWDAIPDALRSAAAVRGCPHLNTGGLRLDLARVLVARRKHLDEVAAYLERAKQFPAGAKEAEKLRRQIRA
jgi:hypothetical protein